MTLLTNLHVSDKYDIDFIYVTVWTRNKHYVSSNVSSNEIE